MPRKISLGEAWRKNALALLGKLTGIFHALGVNRLGLKPGGEPNAG
jgi:hypothetical protein